jgi:Thrombospondin type 3 repeat
MALEEGSIHLVHVTLTLAILLFAAKVPNEDQQDSNNNRVGDACDDDEPSILAGNREAVYDVDNDGIIDTEDNCPAVPN